MFSAGGEDFLPADAVCEGYEPHGAAMPQWESPNAATAHVTCGACEMSRARTAGTSASRTAHEMSRARTADASVSRTAHEMMEAAERLDLSVTEGEYAMRRRFCAEQLRGDP